MTEPHDDDNTQFKLPLDESDIGPEIPAAVDELRMEKLNTRVTIISVLIPVLIVIVLVIAYLDIKKRVVHSEDTGTSSVQKLSSDLESKYSSLTIRQARIEDDMSRMIQRLDQSDAKMEVKFKQTGDSMSGLKQSLVNKKELNRSEKALNKKIAELTAELEELQTQVAALPQAIDTLSLKMKSYQDAEKGQRDQLDKLETKITALDKDKLEKPALDLALRLETLRIENSLKAELETVGTKLKALEKRVAALSAPSPAAPAPNPAQPQEKPVTDGLKEGSVIEQPLPQ